MNHPVAKMSYLPLTPQELHGSNRVHPTYGQSHEIEKLAVRLFLSKIPALWLERLQNPDFAVDFQLEPVQDGEPSGRRFAVQIKGVRPQGTAVLRKSVETKSLAYLRDRERIPAFLFLVDVTHNAAYWVFVQKYLRDHVPRHKFRQKSISVRFDKKDEISDFDRFLRTLLEAFTYMEELYPGSPQAALSKKKVELQNLDPRFEVNISIDDRSETIQILGAEGISLEILEPQKSVAQISDFFAHATPLRVPVEKLRVKDSPLVERLLSEVGQESVQIIPQKWPGCVRLQTMGECSGLIQVDGEWRIGSETATFSGRLARSPLSIDSTISPKDFAALKPTTSSFGFSWAGWQGLRMDILPWLDDIFKFVNAACAGGQVRMTWFIDGREICQADMNDGQELVQAKEMLDWLNTCRSICQRFNLPTTLPPIDQITNKMMHEADVLGAIISKRDVQCDIPNAELSLPVKLGAKIPSGFQCPNSEPADLTEVKRARFPFFGRIITLAPVEHIYTAVTLEGLRNCGEWTELVFKATSASKFIRRCLAAETAFEVRSDVNKSTEP